MLVNMYVCMYVCRSTQSIYDKIVFEINGEEIISQ